MRLDVTEKDFQQAVIDLARVTGWLVYHKFDSRRSVPGFPDLVLVRPPHVIFTELKSERGRLTADQGVWLKALSATRAMECHLWRPSDWDGIERRLARSALHR